MTRKSGKEMTIDARFDDDGGQVVRVPQSSLVI
jgi:hypothetical protein